MLPFEMKLLVSGLSAFAVTWFLLPRLMRIAVKIGLMDHPGERKMHRISRPVVGGIGILAGVLAVCILIIPLANLRGFYAGALLLFIIGFLDDFNQLGYREKFLVQIFTALAAIYFSGVSLHSFGNLVGIGEISLGMFTIPLTVFCMVGVINAINMIDGLDGLAGGVSLIAFAAFAILAGLNGQTHLVLLCVAFCGAVAAFLKHNWFPATLFMGDAGSLVFGFSLAFLAIAITQAKGSVVPPVAALLVMTVPVSDTIVVMARRVMKGASPFRPDTRHIHHIFLSLDFCKTATARHVLLLSGVFACLGVVGTLLKFPEPFLFGAFCAYFLVNIYFTTAMRGMARFKKRLVRTKNPLFYRIIDFLGLLSNIDNVTGIGSRRAVMMQLECEMKLARQAGSPLAVALMDIDDFKTINTKYGREHGDLALYTLANYLRDGLRESDIMARMESDRFIVIMPDTSEPTAKTFIQQIAARLSANDVVFNGHALQHMSFTCTVSEMQPEDRTPSDLIRRIDERLDKAMKHRRDTMTAAKSARVVDSEESTRAVVF